MFKFKGVITCALIALLALLAIRAESHHIAQGDFDRDGDVDFSDFIVFANNFGKYWKNETEITVVKHEVFRDTLVIHDKFDSEAGKRAARMLGFWYLNYEYRWNNKVYEYDRVFIFNRIAPGPNNEGEFTVHGRYHDSNNMDYAIAIDIVEVTYSKNEERYILRARAAMSVPQTSDLYNMECKFLF